MVSCGVLAVNIQKTNKNTNFFFFKKNLHVAVCVGAWVCGRVVPRVSAWARGCGHGAWARGRAGVCECGCGGVLGSAFLWFLIFL